MLFEQNGVGGIRSGFKRLTFLCVPDGIEVGEGRGSRSCLRATIALRCMIKEGFLPIMPHPKLIKSLILYFYDQRKTTLRLTRDGSPRDTIRGSDLLQ